MSSSLQSHGLQQVRLICPSLPPRVCSSSYPLSQWHHPTNSSSFVPFSCPQSFPASGSFPMSCLFTSGGQSIGASASASGLPMNIQGLFHLRLPNLIFLLSKGLSSPQHHSLKASVLWPHMVHMENCQGSKTLWAEAEKTLNRKAEEALQRCSVTG